MAYSEDQIALAAEYVLGTLDADERAQVEAMMAGDGDFRAVVEAWDRKFGALNLMVGSVEPRAEVWDRIRAAIARGSSQQPLVLPETELPSTVPPAIGGGESATARATRRDAAAPDNVVAFSPDVRRWRAVARVMSALAAALLALLAIQLVQPDWLPETLRPRPRIQTVRVDAPPKPAAAQYVALLQKDGGSPAFILTVDADTRNFTVRRIDAPAEPGKSYELWLIADKLGAPRSLGVIGKSEFTARPVLASYDADLVRAATYAVTVEQQGGSPAGKPTSAPMYSGKLIESVPASTL
ncbi:MAG TPA: anti-sigma factor [Nitrobacter sp.]|jgi:anti-sigma-K factor RskA|nr:anti-sigma factor [Nitrobacter sp.]